MIKSILVATDGSAHAKKAVATAAEIAAACRAKLTVIQVLLRDARSDELRAITTKKELSKEMRHLLDTYEVDMELAIASVGYESIPTAIPAPKELLTAIGAQLLEAAGRIAAKQGVKQVSTALIGGEPADAILQAAHDLKADLIVLGTRGLSDFKGLLVGSVSHKVASRAECAVMTVK